MVYWKYLIILKEIKYSSGKSLRVWDKNHINIEIFEEKIKINIQKSHWKIAFFTNFLSDFAGPLSFYAALEKAPLFNKKFSVGGISTSPLGRPCHIQCLLQKLLEFSAKIQYVWSLF